MCHKCVCQDQDGQHICPSHYGDSVHQQSDHPYPSHPCHIHQSMPYLSSDDSFQHQPCKATRTRDTGHKFDCPRHGRGAVRGNNTRPKALACTRHHDSCPRHSHENPCIHGRPRPQLSDSSEDEGYESYTSQTKIHNECALHPPRIKRYDQKYPSDTPKCTHRHATLPVSGTCLRTTVHTSHTTGGGSNIKCVRFSDEEISRTVSSLYSTQGSQSSADHLCYASQQYARPPPAKDPRESRPCSRTVWGPPPPETYSRRHERGFRSGH